MCVCPALSQRVTSLNCFSQFKQGNRAVRRFDAYKAMYTRHQDTPQSEFRENSLMPETPADLNELIARIHAEALMVCAVGVFEFGAVVSKQAAAISGDEFLGKCIRRPISSFQSSLDISILIYGLIQDGSDFASNEGLAYKICTSKALQPTVSLAFLFNRPLMYWESSINTPGSQILLEVCPLTCSVVSRRPHLVDVGVAKTICQAQKTYAISIVKGEADKAGITGSVEQT